MHSCNEFILLRQLIKPAELGFTAYNGAQHTNTQSEGYAADAELVAVLFASAAYPSDCVYVC